MNNLPEPKVVLNDLAFNDGARLSSEDWLAFLYALQKEIEEEIIWVLAEKSEK